MSLSLPKNIREWPQTILYLGDLESLRKHIAQDDKAHIEEQQFDRLKVSHVAGVRHILQQHTPSQRVTVALVTASSMGLAAQNALLKAIEEPAPGHRIVLAPQDAQSVLDTIVSRCVVVHGPSSARDTTLSEWLPKSHSDRLAEVVAWSKQAEKKDTMAELRASTSEWLQGLSETLYTSDYPWRYAVLREVAELQAFADSPASSPKYILEYLALLLPKT